jgi:hypothetical protein
MLTKKQLDRFVNIRNKSGFGSNLQFEFDASECGFSIDDLGEVEVFTIDGLKGYQWKPQTTLGPTRIVEFGGKLYLHGQPAANDMFALMNRAGVA